MCFAKIPMWFALGFETLCSGFQTKSEDEHHLESALKHTAGPRPGGLTQWVQVSPRMCLSNEFPGDEGLRATGSQTWLHAGATWEVSTPPAPMKRCGLDTEHLGPPKSSSLVAWERVRDAGSPPVLTHPDPP